MVLTSEVLTIISVKITQCYTYSDLVVILSSIGNIVSKDRNEKPNDYHASLLISFCLSITQSILSMYLFCLCWLLVRRTRSCFSHILCLWLSLFPHVQADIY